MKKIYAVRKGKKTGLFETWEECRQSVTGFPGAEYKGFSSKEEAMEYLDAGEKNKQAESANRLQVYVDGSYSEELQKYAFGCVFLMPSGIICTQYGNGNNPQSLKHRNVTGEMLGAMYAVKTAMYNGYEGVELYYDYEGIEKWVTGAWKAKTEYTIKYSEAMREWGKSIRISFVKVPAHSNVEYNEMADKTAKKGLTEGDGIPPIMKLEELPLWNL